MIKHSLVSSDGLAEAERELKEIDDQIKPLMERRQRVEKRLVLAHQLQDLESGDGPNPLPPSPSITQNSGQEASVRGPTLVDAVPQVLRQNGPLRPAEIKERLSTVGFHQKHNDNYFYTVISRLSKAGTIVRLPDRRLAIPDSQAVPSGNGAMH